MSTIITDGTITITLPSAFEWVDEFDYSPVTQTVNRTIGGGFIIQESSLLHGRPITLEGGENVWVERSQINAIYTLASVPDKQLTLTLADSRQFPVIFRRDQGNPFTAIPLWRKNIQGDTDKMKRIVLRFYTTGNQL